MAPYLPEAAQRLDKAFGWSRILRVPYRDCGRGFDGWDCGGLVEVLSPVAYGVAFPVSGGAYPPGASAEELARLIQAHLGRFEQGPPGPEFPLLLFRRGGEDRHLGLAMDERWMLHADGAGSTGGTYYTRFDRGEWAMPVRMIRGYRMREAG